MFRLCANALGHRAIAAVKDAVVYNIPRIITKLPNTSNFSTIIRNNTLPIQTPLFSKSILSNAKLLACQPNHVQTRSLTKFSRKKGKKKTVKAVIKRFYRLHWGIWIRTRAGRFRKMWKKSQNRKKRLRQHVFTNSAQSWLLDKMVTNYWRKPKYWVDSPYEPYNTREEYFRTSRKPRDYWEEKF